MTRRNASRPGWSESVAWLHALLRPGAERLLGTGGNSHSAVDTGRKRNFSGVTSTAPPIPPPASDGAPRPPHREAPGGAGGCGVRTALLP